MVINERVISINLTFDRQYCDTVSLDTVARKTLGPPKILPHIDTESVSLISYCKLDFLQQHKKTLLLTLCGKAHA